MKLTEIKCPQHGELESSSQKSGYQEYQDIQIKDANTVFSQTGFLLLKTSFKPIFTGLQKNLYFTPS